MAENHALIPETQLYPQVTMKESQDISKNLMSGDFERQFRGAMAEKPDRRWQTWLITIGVVVAALVAWLLVCTVVREVQIRQLRHEVDELTANMIAITANFKALNQKIEKNKLFNEFKDLQDTLFADEEISSVLDDKDDEDRQHHSLEKLDELTVLEDDSLGDDEDMLDSEVSESGDWYPDYDKRPHDGSTDMMHLHPEDFVDSELSFQADVDGSEIRELKRRLNKNPEDPDLPPDLRLTVRPTHPTHPPADSSREKRSVFADSPAEAVEDVAAPRVFAKPDERRKTKKFSPSVESTPTPKMAVHAVTRSVRNSDYGDGQRRPFVAAHFHGNTSHLSPEIHEHYKGNGLVRVSHGSAHDVWYPSPWTIASPHPRPTLTRNGHIHVHHTGVYLVYVQIYYLDNHDLISWVLHRTNPESDGRDTLLQCAQSAYSSDHVEQANSCFSASALFLRAGDRLAVRNTGGDRHSIMSPETSFIGLVKLADAEDPAEDF